MVEIAAKDVKELRERTGAGIMDAKGALQEAEGDMDKAVDILRTKGQARAAKRGEREASEGVVASYIHHNGRIGALVEIDCETDFVANTDDFKAFAREVASHVAASAPLYVSESDVPEDARAAELKIFEAQAGEDGKPPEVQKKIAEGRMRKWLEEVVLLNQTHVNEEKHESKTIEEMRAELASNTGENVVVRRFARFSVGD
jgi:elongation factor Ts